MRGDEQRVHLAVVEVELSGVRMLPKNGGQARPPRRVEPAFGQRAEQRLELRTDLLAGLGHYAFPSENRATHVIRL